MRQEKHFLRGGYLAAVTAALTLIIVSCQYVVGLHEGDFTDARADPGSEEAVSACGADTCHSGKACDERTGVCVPRACAGMVTVPEGQFLMGSDGASAPADVKPEHTVQLSAFSIDTCEVSVAQYKACVSDRRCSPPSNDSSDTRLHYYDSSDFNDYPVIHVSWDDARTFCEWVGKNLPTEAQWEKAARGGCKMGSDPERCDEGDRSTYPWGSGNPTCFLAHFNGCLPHDTAVCGDHPDGASPYGALDMAGNVSEWVSDWYSDRYYSGPDSWTDPTGPAIGLSKSIRGGACLSPGNEMPVYLRASQAPGTGDRTIGFRCAQ